MTSGWRIRRGPSEPREGGYVAWRKERLRKRNSDTRRAEDAPIRTGIETRGETSARGDRESTAQGGRERASEQRYGGEKETRYARKERRNDIERERGRVAARVKAGGRERRRASARPAEGTRRPHMCSETNVRSECRLLPIIRCRGVPLCARGWSADSVPRFYAARQPGPSARAAIRENRALNVSRSHGRPCGMCLELNPRPSELALRIVAVRSRRKGAIEGTVGLFVRAA